MTAPLDVLADEAEKRGLPFNDGAASWLMIGYCVGRSSPEILRDEQRLRDVVELLAQARVDRIEATRLVETPA